MGLGFLIKKLAERRALFGTFSFAHIDPSDEMYVTSFSHEDDLDRFVNSMDENKERIILKNFNDKKIFFICMAEYNAVVVNDGDQFSLSGFWIKQHLSAPQSHVGKLDLKKAEEEISNFFIAEKKKLVS